jgi:hypothetical protein
MRLGRRSIPLAVQQRWCTLLFPEWERKNNDFIHGGQKK